MKEHDELPVDQISMVLTKDESDALIAMATDTLVYKGTYTPAQEALLKNLTKTIYSKVSNIQTKARDISSTISSTMFGEGISGDMAMGDELMKDLEDFLNGNSDS